MTHFSDGELQAYLDGELTRDGLHEMERHLHACSECAGALKELEEAGRLTARALTELDTLPQLAAPWSETDGRVRAIRRAAAARLHRRARRRWVIAASVILALGLSVTFPASPLRAWLVQAWEQVVLVLQGEEGAPTPPAGDAAPGSAEDALPPIAPLPGLEDAPALVGEAGLHAEASQLPVRILLHELVSGSEIQVVFVDGTQAGVFAAVDSRFTSSPGRLEAWVSREGTRVEVPRTAPQLLLLANGQPLLEKRGDSLTVSGMVRVRDADGILFVIPDE